MDWHRYTESDKYALDSFLVIPFLLGIHLFSDHFSDSQKQKRCKSTAVQQGLLLFSLGDAV